jgi:hypothetical protein
VTPRPDGAATIREYIAALEDAAARLPQGTDARVDVGVCDGTDLQLLDRTELIIYERAPAGGAPQARALLRAHQHPGEDPGTLMRASDPDLDLRRLTGDDG